MEKKEMTEIKIYIISYNYFMSPSTYPKKVKDCICATKKSESGSKMIIYDVHLLTTPACRENVRIDDGDDEKLFKVVDSFFEKLDAIPRFKMLEILNYWPFKEGDVVEKWIPMIVIHPIIIINEKAKAEKEKEVVAEETKVKEKEKEKEEKDNEKKKVVSEKINKKVESKIKGYKVNLSLNECVMKNNGYKMIPTAYMVIKNKLDKIFETLKNAKMDGSKPFIIYFYRTPIMKEKEGVYYRMSDVTKCLRKIYREIKGWSIEEKIEACNEWSNHFKIQPVQCII